LDFFFWELFRPIRAENGELRWPGVPARQRSQPRSCRRSRDFSCRAFPWSLNAPAAVLPSPFASCFFLARLFCCHTLPSVSAVAVALLLHTQVDVGMPPRNGQRPAAKKKSVRPTLLLLCGLSGRREKHLRRRPTPPRHSCASRHSTGKTSTLVALVYDAARHGGTPCREW
jgi:hypothetical protein